MMKNQPSDPIAIPAWFTNPDAIGPCPCGRPMLPGMPYIIMEGELFKRAFHIPCAQAAMQESMFDDDDEF
jgi:hypothetical protein